MGSLETRCLAQGNTVVLAPALETPAQITLTGTHATLTTPLTRSSVTADKASLGPAVTFVPLVTMATQRNPVGSVCRVSATATLTPRTLSRVIPGLADASSACTTLMARHVPTVNMVTMAMLWLTTADAVPV